MAGYTGTPRPEIWLCPYVTLATQITFSNDRTWQNFTIGIYLVIFFWTGIINYYIARPGKSLNFCKQQKYESPAPCTSVCKIAYCKRKIFAQYKFSCISRRALSARKFDVSENYNHNRTNRIKWYVRENQTTRILLLGLDARTFIWPKISTFTVIYLSEKRVNIGSRVWDQVNIGHHCPFIRKNTNKSLKVTTNSITEVELVWERVYPTLWRLSILI